MMMMYNKIFKNEKKKKHQKSSLVESPVELNNCSKTERSPYTRREKTPPVDEKLSRTHPGFALTNTLSPILEDQPKLPILLAEKDGRG